jgi:hypothetical protein
MPQSHYTVQYLDQTKHHQSIGVYAEDAFHARNQAVHDVPYLQQHPSSIDCILSAGSQFCTVI